MKCGRFEGPETFAEFESQTLTWQMLVRALRLAPVAFNSNAFSARHFSAKPPTAVVMLNMGGPATVDDVEPFLLRLFGDSEIIQLGPLQKWLGPLIVKRRLARIQEQYRQIGGSPIRKWTDIQGEAMCHILDKLSPETAPHKHYTCFRYADPLTEEVLAAMKRDGVQRAVAFSQYPQFSCTTTGSSLNHLWRESLRLGMRKQFKWSVIDRWHLHPTFIDAVCRRILMGIEELPEEEQSRATLLFSAHSLPMRVVNRGDPYAQEVGATVSAVIQVW